ncbi:hypothetical protein N3K66_007307 [Trichothecium roseum]|uniref:Uncharacterized protein n=1 Tax=Trichothecium roseum TaxID=47278 RepID=A0ACC0UUW2_9HYPO|nr:hypothetical protein N3K66_007307 [Trichothecium roseum]
MSTTANTTTSVKPEIPQIPAPAGPSPILTALSASGAVIIKNLLTPTQVALLNQDIQPAMDALQPGSRHPPPSPSSTTTAAAAADPSFLQAFHGPRTKRLTGLVPLSPTFRHQVLELPLLHALCERLYLADAGGYWLNTAQAIDVGPGSPAQPLHRDQWQFPVFTACGPGAPHASVNFIVALTRFTADNGATRVVPGSHRWPDMSDNGCPGRGGDGDDVAAAVPAEMEPGDAVFITGKVVHGGGANVTGDEVRRGLAVVFQCSYLTPEEAHPFLINAEVARSMTPRGQRMIGFRSQFLKDSPGVWKRDYGEPDEVYC